MTRVNWMTVVSRITPCQPANLDEPDGPGPLVEPEIGQREQPVSPALWRRDEQLACIGIRVNAPPANVSQLALRLAAIAIERRAEPIILSTIGLTGFEQFGFRVEMVPGEPQDLRAAFEAEVRAFWDITIVIDLAEVETLG